MTQPSDRSSSGLEPSSAATGVQERWNLRLYVAGQTPKSLRAFDTLKRLCERPLPGRYHIEVIDLVETPKLARDDQIVAIPTLVRKLPEPLRKIIGDLSNQERVLVGLDLEPRNPAPPTAAPNVGPIRCCRRRTSDCALSWPRYATACVSPRRSCAR